MPGVVKQTRVLCDVELLAEFEALSDNDTSNRAGESESEVDAEEIGDNYENDSPQDAAQCTKRKELPVLRFSGRRGIQDSDNENSGISANLDENCTVFDIFKLFFMQHIAEQTNS
jgi:hypothetical protein